MDLGPLVKGILVVIGIAMATGHYGEFKRLARNQAREALEWKQPLPYFLPHAGKYKARAAKWCPAMDSRMRLIHAKRRS